MDLDDKLIIYLVYSILMKLDYVPDYWRNVCSYCYITMAYSIISSRQPCYFVYNFIRVNIFWPGRLLIRSLIVISVFPYENRNRWNCMLVTYPNLLVMLLYGIYRNTIKNLHVIVIFCKIHFVWWFMLTCVCLTFVSVISRSKLNPWCLFKKVKNPKNKPQTNVTQPKRIKSTSTTRKQYLYSLCTNHNKTNIL